MGPRGETDPHGILDDLTFVDDYDAETVAEALRKAEQAPSTTPESELQSECCPYCGSTRIKEKRKKNAMSHRRPEDYRCTNAHHFDNPANQTTIPMNDERTNAFELNTDDQLADHEDRGFTPVLRGVADETLTEIVLRTYHPWGDGGPSYRTLAEIVPYSATWVGNCVRAWKDGDYRELVEDPTPSVDASSSGATAVATDGGRRPRRWAAYGSD